MRTDGTDRKRAACFHMGANKRARERHNEVEIQVDWILLNKQHHFSALRAAIPLRGEWRTYDGTPRSSASRLS